MYEKHDQKYFAMLNDAVAIADTPLEGGVNKDAFAYYQYLLTREFPDCPIKFNLPQEQETAIKQGIADLIEVNSVIEKRFSGSEMPTDLGGALDEVISVIKEHTEHTDACYLPSGWTAKPAGHYASLKCRKTGDGKFAFSLLNHGAGIKYHQEAKKSGTKDRRIYQSDEYEVDLNTPNGRELIQRLIEIRFRYNHEHKYDSYMKSDRGAVNEYTTEDLYGLLKLYGKEIPLTDKLDQKAVTPQREGSCTMTNLNAAARDILVNLGADLKTRKRYNFVLKLRSIIDGFEAYKMGDYDRNVLEWGLNEFSVRVNKEYQNVLSDDEVVYCGQLQKEIQERLDADKQAEIKEKSAPVALPEAVGPAPASQAIVINKKQKSPEKQRQKDAEVKISDKQAVTPENIIHILDVSKLDRDQKTLPFIYHLLQSLPHCSGKTSDEFWNKFPRGDIETILQNLAEICEEVLGRGSDRYSALEKQRALAVSLMMYDITAQLKSDETYALGLDSVYSELDEYTDPEIYYTIKRIAENFEERAKGKERVLTNQVLPDGNKTDNTVHYVINVLLNQSQRDALMKVFGQDECSDFKLFTEIFKGFSSRDKDNEVNKILGPTFLSLMRISGTAHAKGESQSTYAKDHDSEYFCFGKSKFYREQRRKKALTELYSDAAKHLPNVPEETEKNNHSDFSENTLYHPRDDLIALQNKKTYGDTESKYPYQIHLSGSINPDSDSWKPSAEKKPLFEEMNEQLRHIECSPNLQVVRTLAWLSKNPDKLKYQEIRARVNELLFAYGRLDSALANQGDLTLERISSCFVALIKYCKEEEVQDPEILSWIGQVSNNLRYHVEVSAKVYKKDLSQVSLPSFNDLFLSVIQKTANTKSRARIATQLVAGFRNKSPLSLDDCALLMICRLIMKLAGRSVASDEIWDSFIPELQKTITNNLKEFNLKINPLLIRYLKLSEGIEWKIDGFELSNESKESGDYVIDLKSGSLKSRKNKELKECTEEVILNNKALCDRLKININNVTLFEEGYTIRSSDGKWAFNYNQNADKLTITSVEQKINLEGMSENFRLTTDGYTFKDNKSPFESDKYFNTHYQYWKSIEDDKSYFVRQDKSEHAYYYSRESCLILQLKENEKGEWQRTGNVLLNLTEPKSEIEIQWAQRLGPLFGVSNIRCTAALSTDGKTCTLQRIEHLVLGLNFIVDMNNRLIWEEDPDYFLSDELGLEVLDGQPSVVRLKNAKGETRIIVPAFGFSGGKKNYAFNQKTVIDYSVLCHEKCKYFEYSLDDQKRLQGKSVEANLYLALFYRSLGDYKQAIYYLDKSRSHQKLSDASLAIAMQALTHPIKSPMGAAFDLKLDCFIQEHQQKWSRDTSTIQVSDGWDKWIVESQLPRYQKTLSNYKEGVSIFPDYCRLTVDEVASLSKKTVPEEKEDENRTKILQPHQRIEKAASLNNHLWDIKSGYSWATYAEETRRVFEARFPSEAHHYETWRVFDKRAEFGPGFGYLYYFFDELLKDAISKDPTRVDSLHKKLFALLMNDHHPVEYLYSLIAILAFASKHPDYFSDFTFEKIEKVGDYDYDGHDRNKQKRASVVLNAGNVLLQHQEELENETSYLFEFAQRASEVPAPQPLPKDFYAQEVHFALAPVINQEAPCKHPLQTTANKYFNQESKAIAKSEFKLDASGLKDPTALEIQLCERYKRGHEENVIKQKTVYKVKDKVTLDEVRGDLNKQKEIDEALLEQIQNSLLLKANKLPKNESLAYNLLLSRASGQHHVIAISDLFTAFLEQDGHLLTAQNPELNQDDVTELFTELANYALISSRIDQVNKVLDDVAGKNDFKELEAYELQLFASTIDKKRAYTIAEYPEFLVYEYATKRILRDDQVETLIKIINLIESDSTEPDQMHHALLQFAAGGGKTSVLTPILAHRFARKGYLPVIFNTNELYETGLEDIPKNLQASLHQNMEVVERELEHKWSVQELQKLLTDLERWRSEHKCLLLKPVTWHSINIARKLAYLGGDLPLAKATEDVLDFFKTKSIKLEDECHIISDPLQQSIKTYEKPLKLPKDQIDLMLKFYDHLMGYDSRSNEIANLAGIKSNQKQVINSDNLIILQKKLAEAISSEQCFSKLDNSALISYLIQPGRARPQWLHQLHDSDHKTADLVILARAYINTHLPHILTMQINKDYGVSIHEGDLTTAPKHEGKDVSSHFGDHSLVVALTIQLFEQNGLTPVQIDQLLDEVLKQHKQEREWNHNLSMRTEAELWLQEFNSLGYPIKTYKDITPELRIKLSSDPHFFKHPIVVKRYLTDFALPQIEVPPERQSSTPAEMQSGFARSLLLSATPGLPEIYPGVLPRGNCFLEEAFESQVIDTLLSPENSKFCHLNKAQTPAEFFDELPADILSSMTTMIDRGALLTDFNGLDVITSYLGLDQKRTRPTTTGVFFSKDKTHLKFESKGLIDIPGTALVETLKKHKIKPEDFLLFLFMDLSKTTGVDIKRPFHDVAGLTVGKEQTVTETIQAAMRERQLLDENAQTVTWIMFQSLYREINPNAPAGTFDPREVFFWMIKNEAKQFTSKLINRAYQGIENEVQAIIWKMWKENPKDFPDDFKEKLKQKQTISPWDIYEQESVELDAKIVLDDFRDKLFERFGFKADDASIPQKVRERIEKIIKETAALIEKLHTPPKVQMGNEVEQEMKLESLQKEEQELEQTLKKNIDSATDFRFAVEEFEDATINSLFDSNVQAIVLPGCEQIKCPELYFNKNHFRVLAPLNPKDAPKFDQLKPIEMLLVKIMPDGSKQYRACTAAEGDYYSVVLSKNMLQESDASYAVITADGAVVSTSNNTTIHACKQWVNNPDTQRMLTYANFMSGRVNNPVLMTQLMDELGWTKTDYETMANTLTPMLVTHCPMNLIDNKAVYNLNGWGNEPRQVLSFEAQQSDFSSAANLEPLHVPATLERDPGSFSLPIARPERALEDYVFTTVVVRPDKTEAPNVFVLQTPKLHRREMTQVNQRFAALEAEVEDCKKNDHEKDYDLRILQLYLSLDLYTVRQAVRDVDSAQANLLMDKFVSEKLAPYKKAVEDLANKYPILRQQYVHDKVEFLMLKADIQANGASHSDVLTQIENADELIQKVERSFEKYSSGEVQNIEEDLLELKKITDELKAKFNSSQSSKLPGKPKF